MWIWNCRIAGRDASRRLSIESAAMRRSVGRPVPPADCRIVAISRANGMAVATRDVRDFEDMGIEVINPWTVG